MRFRLRSLFVLTAFVAVAAYAFSSWCRSIDGPSGVFFTIGFGDATVWAKGYSDDAFRSIKIGMTRGEVHALLGPPLEIRQSYNQFDFDTIRQQPGEIVECWTTTPNDSSYRIRQVVFLGDRVVDKQAEFYLD
jgi:outer membrane protein assembly factor BamE (lipoprotein component of BamABCDE complex)